MRAVPLLLVLLPSVASAVETIPLWAYASWPAPGQNQPFSAVAGTDGWVGGYDRDPWSGTRSGGYLIPITDDNVGLSGSFGDGGPADDWLVRGPAFRDGGVRADLGNSDDDAIGLVLSHDGASSFYLAFHTSDATPPGMDGTDRSIVALLRIEDGDVTVMGRTAQGISALPAESTQQLRLNRDGDHLYVYFGTALVLDAVDPSPLAPGLAGVWSYDCGADRDTCFVDAVNAYLLDTDGDRVADDVDVCELVADPDQADRDRDGIGDACDEASGGGDTDVTGGDTDAGGGDTDVTGGDTDVGTNDTDGPDIGHSLDEDLTAGCDGCSGAPLGAVRGGWLVLGLAGLVRRRARGRAAGEAPRTEVPRC
jgi:hypothetical protein